MELKNYQQEVIDDISRFIERLEKDKQLDIAYKNFWAEKGIFISNSQNNYLHPYDNSVKGVPRITAKVPTAGGKTFIACNALRTIFSAFPQEKPKVVAWFVPSDTILKQTYEKLNNPRHPYRQRIDAHFGNAVRIVDKETALMGQGISPTQISEQLTIFVLSVQSFAANNKEGRRSYRENENLAEYTKLYNSLTKRVEGADETALIQVISYLNPVVIIDESHNFEANLRVEMLNEINPSFILDLTATPRKKSNIISFVDAIKLKQANMVKLPVIVYNQRSTDNVIANAILLRKHLEEKAIQSETLTGKYIRPIVLFQAQPKTENDNITFERIKEALVNSGGIPENQIKIKTAHIDELKNIDLMSRDCEVRYIITVNALKEGWDCPFAYILASLANKTSRVDVEQILGRILRLPYTTQHKENLLNLSYVFTSSANFEGTLENIITGLNRAGFSKKDYQVVPDVDNDIKNDTLQNDIFQLQSVYKDSQPLSSSIETEPDICIEREKISEYLNEGSITEFTTIAQERSYDYNTQISQLENKDIPSDLEDMVKYYPIRDIFKEDAAKIALPIFTKKVTTGSIFLEENSYTKLTKSMLSEGFDLSKEDHNIDFTQTDIEIAEIDLEESNKNEYTPRHRNLNNQLKTNLQNYLLSLPTESQKQRLSETIARRIKIDEIAECQINAYIQRAINGLNNEQILDLITYEQQTSDSVKRKINSLLSDYQKRKFKEWLDTGQISCNEFISLPPQITFNSSPINIAKGLYTEEGDIANKFEYQVISAIANLDNILFWHKNQSRGKGFYINGYINHYPDIIVQMKSGYTVIIETKGDDRDNSDSRDKNELGQIWANKAGDKFRYFMVYDNNPLESTLTIKELISRLKNM